MFADVVSLSFTDVKFGSAHLFPHSLIYHLMFSEFCRMLQKRVFFSHFNEQIVRDIKAQTEIAQLFDVWPWYCIETFMVPRGWTLLTLVIARPFLLNHHDVFIFLLLLLLFFTKMYGLISTIIWLTLIDVVLNIIKWITNKFGRYVLFPDDDPSQLLWSLDLQEHFYPLIHTYVCDCHP